MSSDKRLTRSSDDRMIAGVLGGLANYLGVDPTLLRILYIVLTLITGTGFGIMLYLILWFILPEE